MPMQYVSPTRLMFYHVRMVFLPIGNTEKVAGKDCAAPKQDEKGSHPGFLLLIPQYQ